MKNQKGSALVIALVGILALIISAALVLVVTYVKYANQGVNYETRLEAVWKENQVVLNTYTTKVQEVAQVPDMYKADLKEVIDSTFKGRYGNDGSKAVFQFIKEQNLNLDPAMYRQIQQVMESGRNDFQTSQKFLIDTKANYEASLKYVWSGFWLKLAGYPTVDLNKYKILVLDDVTKKFESGKDEVIKLR